MGTTLRDAIDLIGGGPRGGDTIGVLPGVSGPIIAEGDLDVALTYDAMAGIGSALGAGAFLVLDGATDPLAVARGASRFLAVESCGQCQPCKRDGVVISQILDRVEASAPDPGDRDELASRLATITDGARCYLATQHQLVVSSILEAFPEAYEAHLAGDTPPATPVQIAEIDHLDGDDVVLDPDQETKQPDWTHDEVDSGAAPADRIDQRAEGGQGTGRAAPAG
jgi:NADH:ubiquinone oxidoreductase subunit F (NADH-binding)